MWATSATLLPASARRMAVEDTGSGALGNRYRSTASTSNPQRAPAMRSVPVEPSRLLPKWKSTPATTTWAFSPSTSTSPMNSSAEVAASRSPKGSTTARSRPSASNNSSFWGRSVSSSGAFWGRRVNAGCVSKVTTVGHRSSPAARSTTLPRIC